ncbi:hypothetical protein BC937DRAFT_92469 [Endogone sp. FLAS-F59071]|nr:hypothetical protein BC937DRAFT_92469 [Endogone sp. FLAS-F59071]|eukprot:RUS21500.1 hypothetical protein BC937DRAFT_92469 [Endogone sp. FLAS-F59071]
METRHVTVSVLAHPYMETYGSHNRNLETRKHYYYNYQLYPFYSLRSSSLPARNNPTATVEDFTLESQSRGNAARNSELRRGQRWIPKSRQAQYFIALAIIEALVVLGLESGVFVLYYGTAYATKGPGQGIPIYLIIFIFSQVFQIILAWDSVRMLTCLALFIRVPFVRAQNTIQVIGFILFNLCCLIYGVFQFKQIGDSLGSIEAALEPYLSSWEPEWGLKPMDLKSRIDIYLIGVTVVISACEIVYVYLGTRLYQEFGYVPI